VPALTSMRISIVSFLKSVTCILTTLPSHSGEALAISSSLARIASTGAV